MLTSLVNDAIAGIVGNAAFAAFPWSVRRLSEPEFLDRVARLVADLPGVAIRSTKLRIWLADPSTFVAISQAAGDISPGDDGRVEVLSRDLAEALVGEAVRFGIVGNPGGA